MKVLLVSDTLHAGGAETFVLRLAAKLIETGTQTEILSLNPDMEEETVIRQFSGITIHRINIPAIRWVKRLDRLLRMAGIDFSMQYYLSGKVVSRKYLGYDVYHTHLYPVDYLFARLKRKHPGLVIVSTLHGDYNELDGYWEASQPGRKIAWPSKIAFLKEQIAAWVYISKNQAALFRDKFRVAGERLYRIYNGYESAAVARVKEAMDRKSNADLTFIMVARGIREKGWEYAVAAFRQVKGAGHRLILVGKGEYLEALEAGNTDPRIRFAGFHPAPVTLIRQADVFIFPSVYKAESLPTVIIEALYCSVPVISSDIGEVAEMIEDPAGGAAGFLLDYTAPERLSDALAGRMNEYIGNPDLLAAHRRRAGRAFEQFAMDRCVAQYKSIYQSICGKNLV